MGKIRIKTLGDEEFEKNQKNQAKKRKESKSASRRMVKGTHGGERVVAVGPSEEELTKIEEIEKVEKKPEKKKEAQKAKTPKKVRSKTYLTVAKMIDKNKQYSLAEALLLLPKLTRAKFDETVELHINTIEPGISVTVTLPYGTGKKIRVAIADDKLIANVEKGIIDFDVLLATPEMMPKLSKVAKFLGPRGLMPNPKNGTITKNPQEAAQKYEGGQMRFKTESKIPVIHAAVGRVSFGDKKLGENITTILNAIQPSRIKKVVLKSTMSPGIKIEI